jgi:hypothetical protein
MSEGPVPAGVKNAPIFGIVIDEHENEMAKSWENGN